MALCFLPWPPFNLFCTHQMEGSWLLLEPKSYHVTNLFETLQCPSTFHRIKAYLPMMPFQLYMFWSPFSVSCPLLLSNILTFAYCAQLLQPLLIPQPQGLCSCCSFCLPGFPPGQPPHNSLSFPSPLYLRANVNLSERLSLTVLFGIAPLNPRYAFPLPGYFFSFALLTRAHIIHFIYFDYCISPFQQNINFMSLECFAQ